MAGHGRTKKFLILILALPLFMTKEVSANAIYPTTQTDEVFRATKHDGTMPNGNSRAKTRESTTEGADYEYVASDSADSKQRSISNKKGSDNVINAVKSIQNYCNGIKKKFDNELNGSLTETVKLILEMIAAAINDSGFGQRLMRIEYI